MSIYPKSTPGRVEALGGIYPVRTKNGNGTLSAMTSLGEAIMRKRLRDNGLSLAMFGLFFLFFLGHSIAGYYDYNAEQHAHQQPAVGYGVYLTSAPFWATVFENWESEFLQMAAYVLLTVFLFQRGSAESKDPDTPDEGDEDPRSHQHAPHTPWPVRKGGMALSLYRHSLSLAFGLLFLLSFLGHAASGTKHYNEEQHIHGQPSVSLFQYMGTARFWFESFQNWQSEFLAVGAVVMLSIWLREHGSPESKPVHSAHDETGR
jgi:hypothetical protein